MKWQLVRFSGCLILLAVGLGIPILLMLITQNSSILIIGVVTIFIGAIASRKGQKKLAIALGIEERWNYEMSPKGLFASFMRSRQTNKRIGNALRGSVVPSRTCDGCRGSGRVSNGICPVCSGSGTVML
jgi:hypothetical protein